MPEETKAGGESQQTQPDSQQAGGEKPAKYNPATLEDAQRIIAALEKRVLERDEELKTVKPQLGTMQQQLETLMAARRKELEQGGNHEQLAKEYAAQLEMLKPQASLAKELEEVIRADNEAIIKQVPETMRSIIPMDYPPARLKQWLTANAPLLAKQPAPNFEAGAGGGASKGTGDKIQVTDADRAQAAAATQSGFKMTPEDVAKRRLAAPAAKPNSEN